MKKVMKSMVIGSLAAAMLASGASAADFTSSADVLKDLGLFQGSEAGYDLDRAPDRAEAATMMVRLLGKEAEAKAYYEANADKFPFTDLDNGYEWAKPYVAWLYDQGLTSGATATTFEPGNKCTAQQYTTFLMRALGYSDAEGGDFTYDKAIDFATEKGVVDMFNMDADDFMRDDVVAMSYTALSVAPKSGETDLLTKLVGDKAVDAEKAAPVQKTFETLRNFNEAYKAVAATTSADATADFTMNMKVEDLSVDASGKFNVQVKADPAKLEEMQMALTGSLTVNVPTEDGKTEKMDVPMEMYVKDGVAYTNMMGSKMKQDLDLETVFKGFDMQQLTGMTTMPLCMVDSISQDGNTYKMSYNTEAFNGLFTELFSQMTTQVELTEEMKAQGLTEDMFKLALDLSKADVEVTFKNGGLYDEKADMAMTMEMLGMKVDVTMQMNMATKKVGDAVEVKYPTDLDTYKTLEELTAEAETVAEVVTTETAEAQEVVKQPATEYTFALAEGETKEVSNLVFDKDVTVSGNNAQINFVNCEFKGNIVNTANEYTRVVLEGSTVAGQCVLKNDKKEATLESAFPKFLTDAPINVVCEDCIGSVIALGDFDVTWNGKTYKLQDATLYFDVKNPDAGFVPYKDQQANNFCVAQWWEKGQQQVIVECEYSANL